MICECGKDLGHVTLHTKGLCICGRSIWMQVAGSFIPKSTAIAASLNRRKQSLCVHHREPCISRCGVMLIDGVWYPIEGRKRFQWFANVMRPEGTERLYPQFTKARSL